MNEGSQVNQFWDFKNLINGLEAFRKRNTLSDYFEPIELYRGQPDTAPIVATLFRELSTPVLPEADKIRWLLSQEYKNVCSWFSRANAAGFIFNFDIHPYLNWSQKTLEEFIGLSPGIEKHFGALSMSRHYGCQNRLIDVTKDGMAALYFAVTSAFQRIEEMRWQVLGNNGDAPKEKLKIFKEWIEANFAVVWIMTEGKKLANAAVVIPDHGNNKYAQAQSAQFIIAPETVVENQTTSDDLVFSDKMAEYGFHLKDRVKIPYFSIPDFIFNMDKYGYNLIKYKPSPSNISENEAFLKRTAGVHAAFMQLRLI